MIRPARAGAIGALAVATGACSGVLNPFAGVRRVVAIAHLVIIVVALADIWTSRRSTAARVGWTIVVVVFPIVGLAAYLIAGRQD